MTVREISEASNLSAPASELVRDDSTPSSYLDSLEKQELYQDAIRFQAHHMTVENSIKWAAACIRDLQPPDRKEKDEPLEATENWAKVPADPTRWQAKEAADKATTGTPSVPLAMAVFLSGGSVSPPGAPETPPPQYAAQKLAAGSIMVAVVNHQPDNARERYKRALALAKPFEQLAK